MPTLPAHDPSNRLNYVRTGPAGAPTVVIVHPVALDLTYAAPQIFGLSETFNVVAYDLLGHGASSAPRTGYDLGSLAGDLAAVIRGVGAGAAHIVGLSIGGMIAQTLAVTRPELVRSLSLIGTAATQTEPARTALRARAEATRRDGMASVVQTTIDRWFTSAFVARRPEVIDRVIKTLLGNSKEVHAAMWEAIADLDVAPHLPSVRCPTLVMVGDQDPSAPVAAAQVIADRVPGARLQVIAGASHMAPIEVPDEVTLRLTDFLRKI